MTSKIDTKLKSWGLAATQLYFIIIIGGIPVAAFYGLISFERMKLNELGDFLAGAFGPLAIFWIVLGYFQQGEELRNSVRTLELQAEELSRSVEQQRELVNVTREQLEHERALLMHQERTLREQEVTRKQKIQPKFSIDFGPSVIFGDGKAKYKLSLLNLGRPASHLSVTLCTGDDVVFEASQKFLDRLKVFECRVFNDLPIDPPQSELKLEVTYADEDGDYWQNSFQLAPASENERHPHFNPIQMIKKRLKEESDFI